MAITIDYLTNIISVPQADLTLITGTLYELNTNTFRLNVITLQAAEEGIVFNTAFIHNTEVIVAGTTFARTLEFLFPYSIEFIPDAQYSVRLVGSNNNIFDVENNILVQNQVQVIPTNSAGLIVGGSALQQVDIDAVASAVWDEASADHVVVGSFGGDWNQLKADILRMLGLANENTEWSDFSYDASVPPKILSAKINIYTDAALTARLTDGVGNVVYLLTQNYDGDGSTNVLSIVRIT